MPVERHYPIDGVIGRTWTATAFRLAVVSVKRVVRTYHHIKTGWCSTRRVAHLGMAAALNRNAADDGASNLWLCSGGSLRVTLVRRRAGGHQRKYKHNGRNNGDDCFHRDPRMSALGRLCCKTSFVPTMRNIESRTNRHAHH